MTDPRELPQGSRASGTPGGKAVGQALTGPVPSDGQGSHAGIPAPGRTARPAKPRGTGRDRAVPGRPPADRAPSGSPRAVRRRQARASRENGSRLVLVVLLIAAAYFLLPLVWVVIAATKSSPSLFGSFGLWFDAPQPWENLADLSSRDDGIFWRWLGNTVLYAGGGAAGATILAGAIGYGLAKFPFRGRQVLTLGLLAGTLVPVTALALPLYLLFSEVGLVDNPLAVLLPSLVSPFGALLCRIYAQSSVPDELLEAARVDGAGELRIFVRVAARLMTPALVTVFLFQFVTIWNNFFLPLVVLSSPERYPVTLGLFTWSTQARLDPGLYSATVTGAFVSIVPVAVAVVVLQRFWRGGLTSGSLK